MGINKPDQWIAESDAYIQLEARSTYADDRLKSSLKQQTLLADISQNLNFTGNFTETIESTIRLLGLHTDVSRVYIFEDDPDGKATNNTFEWCNIGISSQKLELQGVPYDIIASWKKLFQEQGRIFSTNIRELPEDLVVILEPQSIKSILVFPMFEQGRYFGFIGFDECTVYKDWEQEEIELLRTIANIISNTFERVKIQKRLAESEAQLKMAIENTEAGLWDWNIPTGQVYFNDHWCTMLGYEKSEIAPDIKTWEMLVHPDDMPSIQDALEKHFSGDTEVYQTTHRLLTKAGTWKWVIDKGKIIERDGAGSPVRAVGTHIDIDRQKNIEEELQKALSTKDKFFSIIAHDLRAPFNSFLGFTQMMNDYLPELTADDIKGMALTMRKSASNLHQLLENLLQWAKFQQGLIPFHPKAVNFSLVIDEILELVFESAGKKEIEISCVIPQSLEVLADSHMLQAVLRNLISNAVKFTPRSGTIRISAAAADDQTVKILVKDSGIGISKEMMGDLFRIDGHTNRIGTDGEPSAGLGLIISRDFVEKLGGKLTVESEEGLGSTFGFTLIMTNNPIKKGI